MIGPGIAALLLLLLVGGLIGGEVLARLLPRWGHAGAVRAVRLAMLIGAAAYGGALLIASLTSRERVLAKGETMKFCGFYLDCHLGAAVESVDRRSMIGEQRADGIFHVVKVRISSDARQATLHLSGPELRVRDGEGNSYTRSLEAERSLTSATGATLPLVRPVAAGEWYDVLVVFDLPTGVREPRLHVADAAGLERVLEGILIGDDDSIFHQPTTLALQ